jgi:hypothetical protein
VLRIEAAWLSSGRVRRHSLAGDANHDFYPELARTRCLFRGSLGNRISNNENKVMLSLPLPLKLLLYCLVVIGTAIVLLEHANKWASDLQQLQIRNAKSQKLDSSPFEQPRMPIVYKVIVVFGTVVIVSGLFTLIFGSL